MKGTISTSFRIPSLQSGEILSIRCELSSWKDWIQILSSRAWKDLFLTPATPFCHVRSIEGMVRNGLLSIVFVMLLKNGDDVLHIFINNELLKRGRQGLFRNVIWLLKWGAFIDWGYLWSQNKRENWSAAWKTTTVNWLLALTSSTHIWNTSGKVDEHETVDQIHCSSSMSTLVGNFFGASKASTLCVTNTTSSSLSSSSSIPRIPERTWTLLSKLHFHLRWWYSAADFLGWTLLSKSSFSSRWWYSEEDF